MSDAETVVSDAADAELHTQHSVLWERIVEYVFVGEVLRRL